MSRRSHAAMWRSLGFLYLALVIWWLARKAIVHGVPISAHMHIARFRGWIQKRFSQVPAHVRSNIQSTLGSQCDRAEVQQIARRHVEFLKRSYPVRILPMLPGFKNPRRWPVKGLAHLDKALELGRGAMLVSGHLGYLHLIAPILRVHGYDVKMVVGGKMKSLARKQHLEKRLSSGSRLRALYDKTRIRSHWEDHPDTIFASLDIRPILDALSNNEVVLIAGDGMTATELVELPLLKRGYPFPTGFMKIAMMMNSAVLPVFAVDGESPCWIRIIIRPQLPIDLRGDLIGNLTEFTHVLDEQLRRSPHLWHYWNKRSDWFLQAREKLDGDAAVRLGEYSGKVHRVSSVEPRR